MTLTETVALKGGGGGEGGGQGGEGGEGGEGGVGGVGGVTAYVRPEELEPGDPLHGLAGSDAALTFYTDRLAPVTITQKGST